MIKSAKGSFINTQHCPSYIEILLCHLFSIDIALMGDSHSGSLPMFYYRKWLLDLSIQEFHPGFTLLTIT